MKIILSLILFLYGINNYSQVLIIDNSRGNIVRFLADATLGDFEGITNSIEGTLELKDGILSPGANLNLIVHLDSIDTGIGLRNSHMREKYLNTEKYPDAQFIGNIISVDAISKIEFQVMVEGNFKIHGVSKSKRTTGKFFDYGDLYKIEAHFDLKLSDFKVESPSFLINKVDDNLKMSIYFYLIKKG